MTSALPVPAASPSAPFAGALAVAVGSGLLAARPVLVGRSGQAARDVVVLFVVLLAAGLAWPVSRPEARVGTGGVVAALALGVAAFVVGRLIGPGQAPLPLTGPVVALNTLAAVSEEAFFRRLVYATLARSGDREGVAVVGSALLFALVHVGVYGLWVLPIDLAAGLLLSWQRWATGSWTVPALTHAVANLVILA